MKKVLFIINPRSGKGQFKPNALDVLKIMSANDMLVTVYVTQKSMDAYYMAKEHGGEYEIVACTGGDGTLDEVVSGIADGGHDCNIGYIPAGSTNDFAHSLHISSTMTEAAETMTKGAVFDCDLGDFNEGHFVYVAAFGIFTAVSYQTDQDMKNVLGHLAYLLEGVKEVANIKSYHMTVTTENEIIDGDFLYGMVSNSESVGGIKNISGKGVDLNDGVFEVLLVRNPVTPFDWQQLLSSFASGQSDGKFVYYLKTSNIKFESEEEVAWTMDGEDGGKHNTVVIKNEPRKLHFLVNPEFLADE